EMGGLRLAVLGEPLPLGVAEAAGAWLEERAAAGRNEMRKAGTDEEVLILLKEAADVCRRAADEAAKMRPDFHSGVPAGFPFAAEPPLPRGAVMMTPAGQRWEEGEGIRRD